MSGYRGAPEPCPRCASRLEQHHIRWICTRCNGVMVGKDELLGLVRNLAPDLGASEPLPIAPRKSAGPLACPFDSAQLEAGRFGSIAIDHCEHGVWFDGEELQRALEIIGLGFAGREANRRGNPNQQQWHAAQVWRPSKEDHGPDWLTRLVRFVLRRDEKLEP